MCHETLFLASSRGEAEGFGVAARAGFSPEQLRANPPIPFEAFDPEFPNQPLEQSRFAGITPERQAANNMLDEMTLPQQGAEVPGMVREFMNPNLFFDPDAQTFSDKASAVVDKLGAERQDFGGDSDYQLIDFIDENFPNASVQTYIDLYDYYTENDDTPELDVKFDNNIKARALGLVWNITPYDVPGFRSAPSAPPAGGPPAGNTLNSLLGLGRQSSQLSSSTSPPISLSASKACAAHTMIVDHVLPAIQGR